MSTPVVFLSHRREDSQELDVLQRELEFRGSPAWRDTRDLLLGTQTPAALKHAIEQESDGFIWYGTRASLGSRAIAELEVPVALARASRDHTYPCLPLFVGLHPSQDRETIVQWLGEERGSELLDKSGLVRLGEEDAAEFATRAARRYVEDLVRRAPGPDLAVSISGYRSPREECQLALDWSKELGCPAWPTDDVSLTRMRKALDDIWRAAVSSGSLDRFVVDADLPLPVAVQLGYSWRSTSRINLSVVQRSMGVVELVAADGAVAQSADVRRRTVGESGEVVVAVAAGRSIRDHALRYCRQAGASELVEIAGSAQLGGEEIREMAELTSAVIRQAADRGLEKHLLVLGPISLAVSIGWRLNATGVTLVPPWTGQEYGIPMRIGATQ